MTEALPRDSSYCSYTSLHYIKIYFVKLHTLSGESLLRTVIEGKMLEKRLKGRLRQMMLDWMMVEGYTKLEEEAQQGKEWRRQTFDPA